MYHTFSFSAFNTTVAGTIDIGEHVDTQKVTQLEQDIEAHAHAFEKICSRFDATSELSLLQGSGEGTHTVSPTLFALLQKAKQAYNETDGLFDSTIMRALEQVGYDESFSVAHQKNDRHSDTTLEKISATHASRVLFRELHIIDEENSSIFLPANISIDLGGIAKGYWVDMIARMFLSEYSAYWLSAGGDIILKGVQHDGSAWPVSVQDPRNLEKDLLQTTIKDIPQYGVATSGVVKRKGMMNDWQWHHIIDPRTGLPAKTDIVCATVCAPDTTTADVYAKIAVLLGTEKATAFFASRPSCAYIFIDKHIHVTHSSSLTLSYV